MEQIGKYAIVGQIGTGGFGVVYEGRDPFLKRRVAIKTCSSEEPEIKDRFFREAEIAGNLQHRNIVTVHDFGVQDGIPYLVQEYLTGEDLDRVVARRDRIPSPRRVEMLIQAAHGLEYAHSRGVIHRDIKPANIRLTAEGLVKIMDFGIAKLSNVASHLTRTGMTLGTAAYLPPEQIRGTAVDHRADLFSFGVTAYELLSYHRPFTGKTISALFWEILQREVEPLSVHWPGCPPALETVVLRCLAKDPEQRYRSFAELIPELEAAETELQRLGRGEEKTAPLVSGNPQAPIFAARDPGLPRPSPAAQQARRNVAGDELAAAAAKVRKLRPPDSGGLLGEVEEALAGARAAAATRKARELLGRGDLEAAERELASLPASPGGGGGGELASVRREVARARADRLLAQAAAQWQQGQPQPALALLDQLLALDPDHQDALRLRESWRSELSERDRHHAETATRRRAVADAVARAEALLAAGDLEGAEAVVAAAQNDLGSQQPLRDLRRRLAMTRPPTASASVVPGGLLEASTVGVAASKVAAARRRAEEQEAARGSGGVPRGGIGEAPAGLVWPRRESPAPAWSAALTPTGPLPPAGTVPPPFTSTSSGPASWASRNRALLLLVGAALLLLVLVLSTRWVLARRAQAGTAPPPAPSLVPSPAASPLGGVGAQSARPTPLPDQEAKVLQHPGAAFPAGMPAPAQRVSVKLSVLVDAQGRPQDPQPLGVNDPRLAKAAQRVAMASTYQPAIRDGAPVPQRIPLTVDFLPPP